MEKARPYLFVAAILLLIAVGWFARGWYDDSLELAIERAGKAAGVAASKAISEQKVTQETIIQPTIEKIRTETKYRDCRHDAEMMVKINAVRGYP